jgi:hypothetical protein
MVRSRASDQPVNWRSLYHWAISPDKRPGTARLIHDERRIASREKRRSGSSSLPKPGTGSLPSCVCQSRPNPVAGGSAPDRGLGSSARGVVSPRRPHQKPSSSEPDYSLRWRPARGQVYPSTWLRGRHRHHGVKPLEGGAPVSVLRQYAAVPGAPSGVKTRPSSPIFVLAAGGVSPK